MSQLIEIQLSDQTFSRTYFQTQLQAKPNPTHLRLHLNQRPSIIKDIAPYSQSMAELQFLNLGMNCIASLEVLPKLSLTRLEQLHLCTAVGTLVGNQISAVRSLRKCHMPCLRYISLVDNKLKQLEGFSQWHCPQLRYLFAYDNQIRGFVELMKAKAEVIGHVGLGEQLDQCLQWQFLLVDRFGWQRGEGREERVE